MHMEAKSNSHHLNGKSKDGKQKTEESIPAEERKSNKQP